MASYAKLMNRLRRDERGFTLIELIIVIGIIGALVAIAVPVYGSIQNQSRETGLDVATRGAHDTAMAAYSDGLADTDPLTVVEILDSRTNLYDFEYSLNDLGSGPLPCVVGTWVGNGATLAPVEVGACL